MKELIPRRLGPHGRPIEVLVVDDSFGDALLLREAFGKAALESNVSIAEDGDQALLMLRRQGRFAEQACPDIILLDLNLPKRDGREVLSEIKQDPVFRKIPVFILSGSRTATEIARSYALHANAYIVKPVNFQQLCDIVSAIEAFWFGVVTLLDKPTDVS